jgi:hypothetical protein
LNYHRANSKVLVSKRLPSRISDSTSDFGFYPIPLRGEKGEPPFGRQALNN